MTCYVCVQLIKFIYIFICICFVLNKVLLKVIIFKVQYLIYIEIYNRLTIINNDYNINNNNI